MSSTTFTKKTLGLESAEPAVTPPPAGAEASFARKPKLGSTKSKKRDIPEGLWRKCPKCSTMIFDKELDDNLKVCTRCGEHFPIGAFFFSSRRRHTRCGRDWSSDVCSSDLWR